MKTPKKPFKEPSPPSQDESRRTNVLMEQMLSKFDATNQEPGARTNANQATNQEPGARTSTNQANNATNHVILTTNQDNLTSSRIVAGNLLELKWTPTGAQDRYRIYWQSLDGEIWRPLSGKDLRTPGARVQSQYDSGKGFIYVTAINPKDEESGASEKILYDPTPLNLADAVQPLSENGTAATHSAERGTRNAEGGRYSLRTPPSELRTPDSALPVLTPPSEVHANVKTPDLIEIRWRAVSKDARYNVYSSATRELIQLRKENTHPIKMNVVTWTPETGLPRYWIVVTTLGENGKESAYSEAIEVVRNPEKSGPGAADAAEGLLRKVLSW